MRPPRPMIGCVLLLGVYLLLLFVVWLILRGQSSAVPFAQQFAAITLAFIAIFQDRIRFALNPPQLRLEVKEVAGKKVVGRVDLEEQTHQNGEPLLSNTRATARIRENNSEYFVVKVTNRNRFMNATNVEVLLTRFSWGIFEGKEGEVSTLRKLKDAEISSPVKLVRSHAGKDNEKITVGYDCYFDIAVKHDDVYFAKEGSEYPIRHQPLLKSLSQTHTNVLEGFSRGYLYLQAKPTPLEVIEAMIEMQFGSIRDEGSAKTAVTNRPPIAVAALTLMATSDQVESKPLDVYLYIDNSGDKLRVELYTCKQHVLSLLEKAYAESLESHDKREEHDTHALPSEPTISVTQGEGTQ